MKTNHLIKFAALSLLCCMLFGCEKENPSASSTKYGSIYGTVTDFVTGDPVSNANVRLNPRGETTLTGSDGTFQFDDVTDGKYSLSLSKNGYVDLDDDYVINIENGNNVRRDVQLRTQVQSFKITVDGVETDTLDFGIDPSVTLVNYTIENNGTIDIDISIRKSGDWIRLAPLYTDESNLEPNCGITKYVEIIRNLLTIGDNIGYVYVSSGTLTKTLVVKAKGLGMPVVSNPILSNIQSNITNVRATVTSDGGWQIVDKGFEYYWYDYGDHYDEISCGPGFDNFQTQVPIGTNGNNYPDYRRSKVRAYASNGTFTGYSGWVYTY